MNERIRLLAEQAEGTKKHVPAVWQFYDHELEKFAELIVQECMDIARNVGTISEPEDFALDRCYEIEQRIQDRFGVE